LNQLTKDLPEEKKIVRSDNEGELTVTVPMRRNDIVLISLHAVSQNDE